MEGEMFGPVAVRIVLEADSAHCTGRFMCDVMGINRKSHLLVAGAYLVMLGGDSCRCAQCSGRLMSDEAQSFFGCWRVTLDAPRIVLDVSCVTRINNKSQLPWPSQYLMKLEGDS